MPLTRVTDGSSGTLQFYDRLAVHSVQPGIRILQVMLFQRIILFHLIASTGGPDVVCDLHT